MFVFVDEELHRADAAIADGQRRLDGALTHLAARSLGQARAGRFFEQLLVAALHRAVALAQIDAVAVVVAEHLHLDMLGAAQILLDVEAVVVEGLAHLALRRGEDVGELFGAMHQANATSTAASRRLKHQREADARGGLFALAHRAQHVGAWQHRQPGRGTSPRAPALCRPSAPSLLAVGQ